MSELYDPEDDANYWVHDELFRDKSTDEPPFDALVDTTISPDPSEPVPDDSTLDPSAPYYSSRPPINLCRLRPSFDALVDLQIPPDEDEYGPLQDEGAYGPKADLQLVREALDATQPFDLFAGVKITETDEQTRFEVPERYIRTPHDGVFILRVYGRQEKFKERDEYGEFRSFSSGVQVWIPHLYPFEQTKENGLPVIMERERCELEITLQPVSGEHCGKSIVAVVKTPFGELRAHEGPESYNQAWISFFKEFDFVGKPFISELVTYPEIRWRTFSEYANEKGMSLKEYLAIMESKESLPKEFYAQWEPNDWQERKPSGYTGEALGSIYVPIDELRKGIAAELTFPCFRESSGQTETTKA